MKTLTTCILIGALFLAGCGALTGQPPAAGTTQVTPENGKAAGPESPVSTPPTPDRGSPGPVSPLAMPADSQTDRDQQAATNAAAELGSAVIRYERSGGFAGLNEQWTIFPDGRVTRIDGDQWQVSPAQVEQLLSDIEALGFSKFDDSYLPRDTCCDRFFYSLTVRQGDETKTVTTIDDAPNVPAELWQALDKVSSLLTGLK